MYDTDTLKLALEACPEEPVHYLLRGEYRLKAGDYEGARDDLLLVQKLATSALLSSDWSYLYQSYHDRADELLAWFAQA